VRPLRRRFFCGARRDIALETEESIMSKGKGGGSFKGHNAKTGAHQPIPPPPQTRRPTGTPVMRIAPRGKSGAKGR
jgi:hypothetical protein